LDLWHRNAEPRAELLCRFDKALALELHHECEYVAVFLTAETMEEALVGGHVERRGLLAVERTQAFPVAPGLLELDVLTDHGNDVGTTSDLVDDLVGNHGCSRGPRTRPQKTRKTGL